MEWTSSYALNMMSRRQSSPKDRLRSPPFRVLGPSLAEQRALREVKVLRTLFLSKIVSMTATCLPKEEGYYLIYVPAPLVLRV